MKNINLLGYDDDLGQSKFDLNLDESSLLKFYQNLHFQTIHESHDETRDSKELYIDETFEEVAFTFKEMIDRIFNEEEEAYIQSEIQNPIVLRGLLILLINPWLS